MSRDMSQVSQLVNSYRNRKEAAATRIRRQTTKNSSQPPMTFRRDPLGTFYEDDDEFQEQQGEDEILVDPSGKYDRISDGDKFETENVAASSDMIAHSAKMCPIQLGFALSQTPAEQMSDFNRRLRAKMACRLNLDYSHIDELTAHNCPDISDVLVRGLKIEGLDADEMSHTIGLLFNHHLTSVFNHARSADAKKNQRIAMDDGPPPNKIGKV